MKKILIAEDEKAYSRALVLKLGKAGYDVKSVENGEEALALLKNEKFDLLLLDLIMPKVNGFSVLEEIKRLELKLPVMVLSNLTQEEDKKKINEFLVIDFIEKSETPIIDVIQKIQDFLKNSIS